MPWHPSRSGLAAAEAARRPSWRPTCPAGATGPSSGRPSEALTRGPGQLGLARASALDRDRRALDQLAARLAAAERRRGALLKARTTRLAERLAERRAELATACRPTVAEAEGEHTRATHRPRDGRGGSAPGRAGACTGRWPGPTRSSGPWTKPAGRPAPSCWPGSTGVVGTLLDLVEVDSGLGGGLRGRRRRVRWPPWSSPGASPPVPPCPDCAAGDATGRGARPDRRRCRRCGRAVGPTSPHGIETDPAPTCRPVRHGGREVARCSTGVSTRCCRRRLLRLRRMVRGHRPGARPTRPGRRHPGRRPVLADRVAGAGRGRHGDRGAGRRGARPGRDGGGADGRAVAAERIGGPRELEAARQALAAAVRADDRNEVAHQAARVGRQRVGDDPRPLTVEMRGDPSSRPGRDRGPDRARRRPGRAELSRRCPGWRQSGRRPPSGPPMVAEERRRIDARTAERPAAARRLGCHAWPDWSSAAGCSTERLAEVERRLTGHAEERQLAAERRRRLEAEATAVERLAGVGRVRREAARRPPGCPREDRHRRQLDAVRARWCPARGRCVASGRPTSSEMAAARSRLQTGRAGAGRGLRPTRGGRRHAPPRARRRARGRHCRRPHPELPEGVDAGDPGRAARGRAGGDRSGQPARPRGAGRARRAAPLPRVTGRGRPDRPGASCTRSSAPSTTRSCGSSPRPSPTSTSTSPTWSSTLFPGGMGRLSLDRPRAACSTPGVEVEARPAGRNVRRLSLLSGGERSLVAMAFLFAVFRSRPSPFYLMDEVEAALDDVNLQRFLGLVHEFRDEAQLIIVSHQKRTMEAADALYGVTMAPGGSSQVVSQRVPRTGDSPAPRRVRGWGRLVRQRQPGQRERRPGRPGGRGRAGAGGPPTKSCLADGGPTPPRPVPSADEAESAVEPEAMEDAERRRPAGGAAGSGSRRSPAAGRGRGPPGRLPQGPMTASGHAAVAAIAVFVVIPVAVVAGGVAVGLRLRGRGPKTAVPPGEVASDAATDVELARSAEATRAGGGYRRRARPSTERGRRPRGLPGRARGPRGGAGPRALLPGPTGQGPRAAVRLPRARCGAAARSTPRPGTTSKRP